MKNEKFNLYGLGNDESFNFYLFDKKQSIAEKLSEIFVRIFKLYWGFSDDFIDNKGKWRSKKINIEKKKDIHEILGGIGSDLRIDLFYGDKKMFMMMRCSQKLRLKFNEELFKIVNMPKPLKSKKK